MCIRDRARQVGFAKIHVFAFSPRKGTAAADMDGAVNDALIKERSQFLHELGIELGIEYRSQFLGQTARVLVENNNAQISGRAERYFTVAISDPPANLEKNQIVQVKLLENHEDRMVGIML